MTVYLIGDSTIQFNDFTTFPQFGWGQMLSFYLPEGFDVKNHAKNGMSSKSFIDFGLFKPVEESLKANDWLLIQFGHNDQKVDVEKRTDPYTTYQGYLRQYIDAARSVDAKPVLITPLIRRQFDSSGSLVNAHGDFPEAMRMLARMENVPLIDLNQLSHDLVEGEGEEKSKKWFMHLPVNEYPNYPEGLVDNTHLKPEGAAVFAKCVADAFLKLYKECE